MSLSSIPPAASLDRRLALMAFGRVLLFWGAVLLISMVLVGGTQQFAWSASVQAASVAALAATLSSAVSLVVGPMVRRTVLLPQLLLDQALITVVVFLSGGSGSGATSLYGLICLAGGWLLGVRGAVATALSAGVSFSLMVVLQQSGALSAPNDQPSQIYRLSVEQSTYHLVVNLLVLLLVTLLASYLAERLERTGGELREARRRAEQAERMAALGRLSAGLAHEIRNPLSSIYGSVQILRTGLRESEDRELCDIVLRESSRLEELVTDMVDLAKPRPPERGPVDVAAVVRDVVALARRSGRASDVAIRTLGLEEAWVDADASQLRQMIWNLVRNAVQASASGGEVRVRLEEQGAVVLAVEDDGVGIDSEARLKLFDAFFTTRSHGTGIGLAVVKRIADDHGFKLVVESDEGDGARFIVKLGPQLRTDGRAE